MASLALIAPLLALYEVGILMLGPGAARNGADVWLRQLLGLLGLGQYFLLPLLTVGVLLTLHFVERERWRFSPRVCMGMALECAVLAFALLLLARFENRWLFQVRSAPWALGIGDVFANMVSFAGAGIYEELLFRLILLPAVAGGLRFTGLSPARRLAIAIAVTSVLFSLAHYVGSLGDAWSFASFFFRFSAGVFFSVLFVYRGFGIVAGTHAGYDMLVGILLAGGK